MSASAQLRLVVSRTEDLPPGDAAAPPPLTVSPDLRPAPPRAALAGAEKSMLIAAAATFAMHAAVLGWMAIRPADEAGRSAGLAQDAIFLEGIPVALVQSVPTPEAPPSEASEATPPPPEEETPPPEPEPEVEPPPPEPERAAEPPPPVDEALPPAEAETGELPARPDEPQPVAEPPTEEPPPAVEPPPPEQPVPPEDVPEAPPPDPATVPTPREKPQPPQAAAAASAPSAATAAVRSGGAGGGGASETAGEAEEAAYRAKVAARLASKRFYPGAAARQGRPTGNATVRFTLDAEGNVTSVTLVHSAGVRVLDDAAIEMVRRGAPYPPIPESLGSTITIQAPIGFERPR